MRTTIIHPLFLALTLICQWLSAEDLSAQYADKCPRTSPDSIAPAAPTGSALSGVTFTLNIDFHDLVVQYQEEQPEKEKDSIVYPECQYIELLNRAAASGFKRVYFRVAAVGMVTFPSSKIKSVHHRVAATVRSYDPLLVTITESKRLGMETFVWMTPFDDAGSGKTPEERAAVQSEFSIKNREFQMAGKNSRDEPIWGFYCFAYEDVKEYWMNQVIEIQEKYKHTNLAGFFFSDRTHSNIDDAKRVYGYNEPIIDEYKSRYGVDPREQLDLMKFSALHGQHYTSLLRRVSSYLRKNNRAFHVKASWDNNYRISTRLGGLYKNYFDTTQWEKEGLIDELIIGGDTATNKTPEFIISSFDTFSPINEPRNFLPASYSLSRWLTLFDWEVKNIPKQRALKRRPPQNRSGSGMVTTDVIRQSISLVVQSGVRGILLHEAMLLDLYDDWDFIASLTCTIDDQRDSDGDGRTDCQECAASTGSIGCPASQEDPTVTAIRKAYLDITGVAPRQPELTLWLPLVKNKKTSSNGVRSSLTRRIHTIWTRQQQADLIQLAFIRARGNHANAEELNIWLDLFDKNSLLTYQTIESSLVNRLATWRDRDIDQLVRSVYYHTRGDGPFGIPLTSVNLEDRAFVRENGFRALVEKLQTEHRIWANQHIDYTIREAYKKRGKVAEDADLEFWRPIFRKGDTTFNSISETIAPQ